MPSIAKFMIMFSANANGVNTGVSQAQRSLGRMEKAAASTDSRLRMMAGGTRSLVSGLAGLAVGVVSVQKLSSELAGAVNRLDDLGDRAKGLGETAERLDQIGAASVLLGSTTEAATSGLGKLTATIATAINTGGTAAEVLSALGLDMELLASQSPAENFVSVASAIGSLETVYERVYAARALFGKGAIDLMPIFDDPSEIEAAINRYNELTGGISDAAELSGQLKEKTDELAIAMNGLYAKMIEAFGPEMVKLIGGVTDAVGQLNRSALVDASGNKTTFWDELFKGIGENVIGTKEERDKNPFWKKSFFYEIANASAQSKVVGPSAEAMDIIRKNKPDAELIKSGEQPQWDRVFGVELADAINDAMKDGAAWADRNQRISSASGGGTARERYLAAQERARLSGGSRVFDVTGTQEEMQQPIQESIQDIMAAAEQYDEMLAEGQRIYEENMTAQEKYNAKMEDLNDKLEAGVISLETFERASTKAWEELERSSKKAKGAIGEDGGIVDGAYDNGDAVAYGIDPVLQQMIDFSMPRAGFAGDGSMPANWRLFSPPEMGPRQSIMARDVLDGQGVPYFQNDTQVQEQTNYLRQIAQNTAAMGVPA